MSISLNYTMTDTGLNLYHNDVEVGNIIYHLESRRFEVNMHPLHNTGDSPSDDGQEFVSLEAAKYYALAMYIEGMQYYLMKQ